MPRDITIIRAQHNRCALCLTRINSERRDGKNLPLSVQLHHVHPKRHGGTRKNNLVAVHSACHVVIEQHPKALKRVIHNRIQTMLRQVNEERRQMQRQWRRGQQ